MAIFRVERNKGYTIMSNHHLRNNELSLKAKGLLSQMLSLPEDWDYTLTGLSRINRESIDAIREAVRELERAGYIVRSRERDERGRLRGADYVIYEQPKLPGLDSPILENPTLDNPTLEKPMQENPMQFNKDGPKTVSLKKEKTKKDVSCTASTPIPSSCPSPYGNCIAEVGGNANFGDDKKQGETVTLSAVEVYRNIIKDNISYDILVNDRQPDLERLNEIVDIMLETVCTARKTIRIASDDYPAELVKSKFLRLNSEHIRFVLDSMQENKTKIRSIKQYLRAVLFNAPSTIGNHYTALVAHDIASGKF